MNTLPMGEAVAEGLREAGCEVDLFHTNDGRFDITQLYGNLEQFIDDRNIADVPEGMEGREDKLYALFLLARRWRQDH